MDPLDGVPERILGLKVKTRWQISFNYLIPCIIELLIFISLVTIDGALVYQHLLDRNSLYAWLTLGIICVPAVLTFISIMSSDQWPAADDESHGRCAFFGRQLMNLLLFPFCAIYRFSRKIFWCVEALFYEKNTYERHQAISKAGEHSPFELYHFLQSFFHAAPQIILQLFILLRESLFRNYNTAFVQSLSVVFALIKMAMTIESYQRFESQKLVGRNYPWLAPHQVHTKSTTFRRTLSAPTGESLFPSVQPNFGPPKTLDVNVNNFDEKTVKTHKKIEFIGNITDDDKLNSSKLRVPDEVDDSRPSSSRQNVADDDLMENVEEMKSYLKKLESNENIYEELDSPNLRVHRGNFDQVPDLPPPPRPTSTRHPYLVKLHRLSTFKDMLVFNTENFIKEKIPRIPVGMFEHNTKELKREPTASPASPTMSSDENDILLPTRKTLVDGIENDDVIAKFISFLGWAMFLVMRMISISVFAVFYPEICGWACLAHYLLMLICLVNETRFIEKWQRTGFYFILAYIFIFNLMEFKVKFKNIRRWYVGYFLLVLAQNIAMTVTWYNFAELLDGWWFEFMLFVIIQSGILSVICFIFYFHYLKPKDKVFFVNE